MALSLDAIFKPLNDFFIEKYKTQPGSQVLFRFDQIGSTVSDADFIDENHPEGGYVAALVKEKFSDLVNRVPIDAGDGVNVFLSANSIDTTYFARLMGPAQPYIAPGIDEASKDAIIGHFSTIKAGALAKWDQLTVESLTGLLLDFKPAFGTPENWYDMTSSDSWTSHSIDVTGQPTAGDAVPVRSAQLWRLKVPDASMRAILELPNDSEPAAVPAPEVTERLLRVRDHRLSMRDVAVDPVAAPAGGRRVPSVMMASLRASAFAPELRTARAFGDVAARVPAPSSDAGRIRPSVRLHDEQLRQVRSLDVRQRIAVAQVLAANAPTEPVTTDQIHITFEYCPVTIERPWLVDTFITPGPWFVPGTAKGDITSGDAGDLTLLPIGFIALRNLKIEANWSEDDKDHASQATALGPFSVDADIVNGKLAHPGLQIVGWVLQRLPELPPFGAVS